LAQQHAIMVIKTKSAVYLIYISLFHYKTHFMKDLQHQLHLKKKCAEKIIQLNSVTNLVGFVT